MSKFIIISQFRSASTHLATFLDGVPSIEMFNPYPIIKHDSVIYEPLHRRCKSLLNDVYDFYDRDQDNLLGIKVISHQMTPRLKQYIKVNKIKIIFLGRENKLEHALSFIYSKKSKIWHNIKDKKLKKVRINDIYLNKWVDRINKCNLIQKSNIDSLKHLPNIQVDYSDVITNDGKKRVLDFLGIPWDPSYNSIESETKILTSKYEDYFHNYDEVVNVLKNKLC